MLDYKEGTDAVRAVKYALETYMKFPHMYDEQAYQGSLNSANQSISRIEKIEVKFNYKSKYDEVEFARQLTNQEKGMNELTVAEYLQNRERYIAEGRSIDGSAAQQAVRENAYLDKVAGLRRSGMPKEQAEIEAKIWMGSQAALHNPDPIAGGNPLKVDDVGDTNVNSSIGIQWKYRIDKVDEKIRALALNMTESERENTFINVKLIY